MSIPATGPERALHDEVAGFLRTRQFGRAASLSERARQTFPQAVWPLTFGAYAQFQLGRNQDAIAWAAESLATGPVDVTALFVLGSAHGRLGNAAAAAQALERAHEKLPDRPDIAAALLEQSAAAYGPPAGRRLFERLSRNATSPQLTAAWAKLQFRAGAVDLPEGYVNAPLLSVPAWAASRGLPLDWSDSPITIPWEEPAVAGEPDLPRQRGEYLSYAPYVATLRDATIFSKSNMVLTSDGAVLDDTTADEEFGQFVTDFMSDLVVSDRRDDRLLLNVGKYQLEKLDACLHMAGSVSEHFGHWTSEYLLRLYYFQHHPRFAELPIVVDEQMPPQHLDYLRLVVDNPIVTLRPGCAMKCRELVVAAPVAFFPVHPTGLDVIPPYRIGASSAGAYEFIRERAASRLPPPGPHERKVYLSRRRRGRRPNNEDEISAHLEARGFEVVYPEDLSFADQARVFQEARVIVAPNGSALMNCVFCPPGTRVIVLSQRGVFNWSLFYSWAINRGCKVIFVCGAEDTGRKHDNYTIDTADLDLALAE